MESKDLIVLSEDDQCAIEGLPEIFQNYMTAHSEFQIRNFILNDVDVPTNEGKYHQSVRELWARYNNIQGLSYEFQKLEIEIELLEVDLEESQLSISKSNPNFYSLSKSDTRRRELQSRLIEIEIHHKQKRITSLKKQASETLREMKVFLDVVHTLDAMIPEEFRDETGLPSRELSETKYWFHKQFIAQKVSDDLTRTPFGRLLNVDQDGKVEVGRDCLGRLVILPANQQLENKSKVQPNG